MFNLPKRHVSRVELESCFLSKTIHVELGGAKDLWIDKVSSCKIEACRFLLYYTFINFHLEIDHQKTAVSKNRHLEFPPSNLSGTRWMFDVSQEMQWSLKASLHQESRRTWGALGSWCEPKTWPWSFRKQRWKTGGYRSLILKHPHAGLKLQDPSLSPGNHREAGIVG